MRNLFLSLAFLFVSITITLAQPVSITIIGNDKPYIDVGTSLSVQPIETIYKNYFLPPVVPGKYGMYRTNSFNVVVFQKFDINTVRVFHQNNWKNIQKYYTKRSV